MTIDMQRAAAILPAHARSSGHDHSPSSDHHHHHPHRLDDVAPVIAVAPAAKHAPRRAGFSPFLASAVDRFLLALVLAGLIWIGVVWAVA